MACSLDWRYRQGANRSRWARLNSILYSIFWLELGFESWRWGKYYSWEQLHIASSCQDSGFSSVWACHLRIHWSCILFGSSAVWGACIRRHHSASSYFISYHQLVVFACSWGPPGSAGWCSGRWSCGFSDFVETHSTIHPTGPLSSNCHGWDVEINAQTAQTWEGFQLAFWSSWCCIGPNSFRRAFLSSSAYWNAATWTSWKRPDCSSLMSAGAWCLHPEGVLSIGRSL